MIKVLVFGTFDILHEGHLNFFKQAREASESFFGEKVNLIAVVGRDSTVQRVKKKLPKQDQYERLLAVKKCGLIDEARMGNEGVSVYKVLEQVKPDMICLGYDQFAFTDKLEEKLNEFGLKAEIRRMKAYKPEIYHSSILSMLDD
ncbi:MAG: hypothetical protein A3D35_00815 [Candidatus Staskawiczbacteria bacterium RIFCSPHIGHO2_02_FULL_34_9]|uniref:Cytidyltransferase-like domain-containing protein n=1 Tax=Candidatus Staskawiczbacteria bacterium RIFCSPHIGHO2_02_FULL_34_9 TaxID=1802206 RepID=A0A1G2HYJ0_9BACT|nr:MAG: hypothetical protein A3D35_00815 [Candidatus Staskawiczbacteria bacterium RIFCSPHIGHO2_02_FULL_34_9]